MNEHRIAERIEFREAVQFHITAPLGVENYEESFFSMIGRSDVGCLAVDLSEGGLKIHSNYFVPLHTLMNLTIHLNAQQMVTLSGEVVWAQKLPHAEDYRLGLKFDDTSSNAQSKKDLQEFIDSRRY